MIVTSLPLRHAVLLLPLPWPIPTLVVLLVVLVVWGGRWWCETRDDPVLRGQPYGQVIPDRWQEPGVPPRDEVPELDAGRAEPTA